MPLSRMPISHLPLSPMPMEWLDAGSWRLPSGKALAEFALQAGFLAPLLFKSKRFAGKSTGPHGRRSIEKTGLAAATAKQMEKGSER
jgi:hypothetical protein